MNKNDNLKQQLDEKRKKLCAILTDCGSAVIALSGGVDSTFLLCVAKETLGDRAVAVTALAPNFAPDEIEEAKSLCKTLRVRHLLCNLSADFIKTMRDNPPDRCYHCKKAIFGKLQEVLAGEPALRGAVLMDGTNADDAADYRPGERALSELGVRSPLREAGLTKEEIRLGLKEAGLPQWNKPAFACLASRIPYGEAVTEGKMTAIYTLEKKLRASGFSQVRVRHHGEVARIEVLPEEREKFFDTGLMDEIHRAARDAGFAFAALDLSGYRMGSLNQTIR